MRLQLLELSGFKSFPNRSEIAFDHGVTAIVGPNGCGKSNLVDAITWVLGEQSAKSLRGERMDDVIFGGSDGRRPTAAAEVKLLLKDVYVDVTNGPGSNGHGPNGHGANGSHASAEEASERVGDAVLATVPGEPAEEFVEEVLRRPVPRDVELARRLYRSGESEYLIDGRISRLRDVQDLLMSAGIGVKGYAVIEQGKIGQILSARPNERRQLIEEAAGVTKFKSRRHAAELKLDAAQQNLSRVDDIIYEIEKQRGALKRQSAKARRFERLRDELRRWEKVLFVRRHRALTASLESILTELSAGRSVESGAQARVQAIETSLERLREALAASEAVAGTAREDAHACELDVRRHQQQIEFDRQQVEVLAQTVTDLTSEHRTLTARREPQQQALFDRREAVQQADRDRDDAHRALEASEEAYASAARDVERLDAEVEASRAEVQAAANSTTALQHVMEHASAGYTRLNEDLSRLDRETEDLRVECGRASAEHARAEAELRLADEALARLRTAIGGRRAELTEAQGARDVLGQEVRALEQRVTATRARLGSLQELSAARAGYGDAARFLLAETDAVEHLGSVADHLDVDRAYEQAVEGALGDLLEYIVVPTHADAARALAQVRARGAGRCGFVVLESPSPSTAHATPAAPPDGVRLLTDLIRVGGAHGEPIRRALGHVWLADSFVAAAALARSTGATVVTPAGELFRGAHLVQGIGKAAGRGILSTKGEIRDLDQRLALEDRAAADAERSWKALEGRIAETEVVLATLTSDLHEQEKLIVSAGLHATRATEELERLARRQKLVETDRHRAAEARQDLQTRQDEAQQSITRLEGEQQAAFERFRASQRALLEARASTAALGRAAADAKASHARLVERSTAGNADVARIESAVEELEHRIRGRADELARTHDRVAQLERAIQETGQRLEDDRQALAHLHEVVERAEQRVLALQADCHDHGHTLRDARVALDDARSVVGHVEVNRAKAEADLAHLTETCVASLHATLDDVTADVARMEAEGDVAPDAAVISETDDDDVDVAAEAGAGAPPTEGAAARVLTAEEAVVALRDTIERLGPINMMAIEQFDELETRHSFLTDQRQDLTDSIASTSEAIKRIERTTRERFKVAFETINTYFATTFTTMFGGGRAGLVLLDESDLLETGIDIIAQPPGKRLQNVQLLSGGEKALTAIALMFAIFRYRPSPFCLLDEIDAPLDDANIGRFVEMLRGMLAHTQFILITHNRRTMEIADRLYGVTMEEPGVSKLVSVNLN